MKSANLNKSRSLFPSLFLRNLLVHNFVYSLAISGVPLVPAANNVANTAWSQTVALFLTDPSYEINGWI